MICTRVVMTFKISSVFLMLVALRIRHDDEDVQVLLAILMDESGM